MTELMNLMHLEVKSYNILRESPTADYIVDTANLKSNYTLLCG